MLKSISKSILLDGTLHGVVSIDITTILYVWLVGCFCFFFFFKYNKYIYLFTHNFIGKLNKKTVKKQS